MKKRNAGIPDGYVPLFALFLAGSGHFCIICALDAKLSGPV
ncbi:hypothetical protein [Rhizobium leguminosarum]|nr:hypothetical protein [Rhizobium leguminosarum]